MALHSPFQIYNIFFLTQQLISLLKPAPPYSGVTTASHFPPALTNSSRYAYSLTVYDSSQLFFQVHCHSNDPLTFTVNKISGILCTSPPLPVYSTEDLLNKIKLHLTLNLHHHTWLNFASIPAILCDVTTDHHLGFPNLPISSPCSQKPPSILRTYS